MASKFFFIIMLSIIKKVPFRLLFLLLRYLHVYYYDMQTMRSYKKLSQIPIAESGSSL